MATPPDGDGILGMVGVSEKEIYAWSLRIFWETPPHARSRILRYDGSAWNVDLELLDGQIAEVTADGPDRVFARTASQEYMPDTKQSETVTSLLHRKSGQWVSVPLPVLGIEEPATESFFSHWASDSTLFLGGYGAVFTRDLRRWPP